MRLRSLKIAGFRGFNHEETLEFDEALTLVCAPNSHGKTSITEALEFLIFGETSKVVHADSKEEYKDSYRNRHFPDDKPSYIEAIFVEGEQEPHTARIELDREGTIRRFFDSTPVEEWPFLGALRDAAPPFVLQHALKNLLLVPPAERFQGFAQLLGLYDVDAVQRALVNLCTKPEANIHGDAKRALEDLRKLHERIVAVPTLKPVGSALAKGVAGLELAFKHIHERAEAILKTKLEPKATRPALELARREAAAKVYDGSVAIGALTPPDQTKVEGFRQKLESLLSAQFIESYTSLGKHDALERLKSEAAFLEIGIQFAKEDPSKCPFCEQVIGEPLASHIAERHQAIQKKLAATATAMTRSDVREDCASLFKTAEQYFQILSKRSGALLSATSDTNLERVHNLFEPDGNANWKIVESASLTVRGALEAAQQELAALKDSAENCVTSIDSKHEEISEVEALVKSITKFLQAAGTYSKRLDDLAPALVAPEKALRQAVDALAGTTELALLIELLDKRDALRRALKIEDVMSGLKVLKKHVEQSIGEVMEAAIGTDLSGTVMSWYGKIRTKGDPDVHFSGFAMERTKTGDFKSRKVKVSAISYGKELASAVSSLSESKLNALGLCVSIATTLRAAGPWEFLVLDDPIQSWDEDHEVQFIDVLRALIGQEGKQVVLLTHRRTWADQVAMTCRSLNGLRYEFTGYTKDGPHIQTIEWAPFDERLRTALAIANNPGSSAVKLQQAEEEIRIAACQMTADIAKRKLKRDRSPHNLNSKECHAILVEAGCPDQLTDRVIATFATTDDAHHAPKKYEPNAQRIKQYHGALSELKKWAV